MTSKLVVLAACRLALALAALGAGTSSLRAELHGHDGGASGSAQRVAVADVNQATAATGRVRRNLTGRRGDCSPPCPLQPTADVELEPGIHLFTTIDIPAGVTVRAPGRLLLYSDSDVHVAGMLLADCGALEIHAQAEVTITGTLDNRCLGDAADAGDLVIRTEGGNPIAIGTPEITVPLLSDGGLDISNDSTLEDWEFDVLPYQRSSVPVAPVCSAYASPLAGPGIEGLPLAVRFRGDGADPDGGPVTYLWNFGDGGSSTDEEPEHEYAAGASYDVTLTVTDDDGESCVATARVTNAEAEPAVALLPALLVVEVGEPLSLAAYSKGATSHAWEFGDGTQSAAESVEHAYASPGRYEVTLQAADGGATIEARAAVWVYPHPPAPAPLAARNRDGEFGSYINGHYRPSRSEDSGYLSRGRDTRIELKGDVIIASGCLLHAQDGFEPPTVSHYFQASGAMGGRGGDVWLGPTGDLTIEAGATIEGGDGGKGGGAVVRSEQGSGIAKGGLGGSGGDVHLYGPEEVSLGGAGAVTRIRAGSGVTGGDAVVDFSIVDDFPDCWEPSASRGKADAVGGDGGEGGTLTLINRDVTGVNTLAGGGNGGAGGAATATAVRGYSSTCDGPAAGRRGGQAVALGGDGGAVRQKRLEGLDVAFGSFRTGDGGAAIANGGHGGNATSAPSQSCAEAEATGGEGGPAEALGGEVGRNLGGRGPATYGKGGDAQANGGAGGDAAASAQACTPCLPGGRAYAYGGRGGPAGAVGGTPSIPGTGSAGDALGRGGDGGDSSAYGGTGGDCTFCPDGAGGNGGLAVADAGEGAGASGSGTTVEGDSGDSLAAGGAGGRGASCCEPPTYGGDGGAGGNAIVYTPPAGDPAVASSSGGLGGSGGDGVPQGAGGPGGEGIVVGAPGVDGEPCPPSSLEAGAVRVPFADAGNSSPNGFRRGATGTWLVSSGDVTYVPTAPQQQQQIASAALAGAQPHAQAAGTARQVTLPGIEPYDVVELDDGSAIVAGRTLTTFRGWLGRLLADGSLAWQMTVQEAKSFRTLARVDASTVVAAFEDVANSQVHVLRFSTAGTVVSTTKLTTPAQSLVKAILPLAGGGLLIAVNAGLILPTDAIVIRIDSGGTIAWQQRFGRVSMVSLLEASGDLYLVGSYRPPAASINDGWVARLAANGSVIWQRTYGAAGAVAFSRLMAGPTGLIAFGRANPGGNLRLVQLAADGTVQAVHGYGANGFPLGAGLTDEGGVAMGAHSFANGYTSIVTAPDLTLPGCGDPALGAVIGTDTIPTAPAAALVSDPGMTVSSVAGTTATTSAVPSTGSPTPTDLCVGP